MYHSSLQPHILRQTAFLFNMKFFELAKLTLFFQHAVIHFNLLYNQTRKNKLSDSDTLFYEDRPKLLVTYNMERRQAHAILATWTFILIIRLQIERRTWSLSIWFCPVCTCCLLTDLAIPWIGFSTENLTTLFRPQLYPTTCLLITLPFSQNWTYPSPAHFRWRLFSGTFVGSSMLLALQADIFYFT